MFISRLVHSWKKLDRAEFSSALRASALCQPAEFYSGKSTDELFDLYNVTLGELVNKLVPSRRFTACQRLTSPWFNSECRLIKRRVRQLEQRYRRTKDPADRLAWITAIRGKHHAFVAKENAYWEAVVTANAGNPQKLWRSVSTLLGSAPDRSSATPPFLASDFLQFLD